MRKLAETSLTAEQYNAVKVNSGLFAPQAIVQQRSLEFTLHSDGQPEAAALFDAIEYNGYIIKVYISNGNLIAMRLDIEAVGEELNSWETIGTLVSGVEAVRPSLAGGQVFYVKNDAVWRVSATNPAATPELIADENDVRLSDNGIGGDGEITHVAASDGTTCFIACYRADFNTNIVGARYTGVPWSTFNSDVYWPHKLNGMDAAALDNGEANEEHVLVISTDLPPLIGQKADGTTVRRIAERRNGLIAFRVQNLRFSDHYLIEVYDDASDYQYRSEPRLTELDSKVVLTAFGNDGKKSHYHSALHYYFTVDGRSWETDQLLNLSNTYNGAVMITAGNFTYLVTDNKTYRSPTTAIVGDPHPDYIEDITRWIVSYNSDQSGTRQSSFVLKNTGWLASSLLAKEVQLILNTNLGIWASGQKLLIPISTELIEIAVPSREKPTEEVSVQSRDFSALINGHVRSPHSREYDTQVLGADKYYDFTGTGYGGLAHTAAAEGTFSTADNWLLARSSNKRSVAFNTFKSDGMWNGLIEAQLQIDEAEETPETPTDTEYIGLVVRAYDKDNYIAAEYVPSTDVLRLVKYVDGTRTELTNHFGFGWEYGTSFWLRVMFRYSKIRVFTSADGAIWTLEYEYMLPGKDTSSAVPTSGNAKITFEDGLVGVTGLGYTKDDDWPDDDDDDGGGDPDDDTTWGSGTKSALIACNIAETGSGAVSYGLIAYTRACTTGPWNLLHGGIQTLINGKPQVVAGMALDPFDFGAAYLIFGNGDCYYHPDWRSGGNWELFASAETLQTAFGNAHGIDFDNVSNVEFTMAANGYLILTVHAHPSWGAGAQGSAALIRLRRLQNGIDVSPFMRLTTGKYTDSGRRGAASTMSARNANLVMSTSEGFWNAENHGAWIVDWTTTGHVWTNFPTFVDGGVTFWSPKFQMTRQSGSHQSGVIWSPYKKLDGTDNLDDQQMFWAGPGDRIWKSDNGGLSFAPWTGSGVCPRAAGGGARLYTCEINIDQGAWVDYIRSSGDNATYDKLHVSEDAGVTWRSVMLPGKNVTGWEGGFPSKKGQFYIAASPYGADAMAWEDNQNPWAGHLVDRDTVLAFTSDGGQTWKDWTWNLWTLKRSITSRRSGMGVIRFYPHPTEK